MKYVILSVLAAISFCQTFAAESSEENVVKSPVQMMLPINWASSDDYDLIVNIPKGYTALQGLDAFATSTLIEFVPLGEDGKNWSEIITVHKLIGTKVSAIDLVQKLKEKLLENMKEGKILKETYQKLSDYQDATLLISYDDEHHEILGVQYYSGPFDCVGVQYTIRESNDQKAQEKIEDFFKTAISVRKQAKTKSSNQ